MAITRTAPSAMPFLKRMSLSFLPALDHWAEARQRRQIRQTYGEMGLAQLRDIGLTPWDVAVALSLPLEESAADAVATAAANEAARW
jgi:uncharacterized protein YjiS (DUF1127 family)